ncbi:MAG: cutinase family protein [Mycobacterium sp.]
MRVSGALRAAIASAVAAAALLAPVAAPDVLPVAGAACPDVEVIFARGRLESPGAGILGNAFFNALQSKLSKSVDLYAVKYPANTEVDIGANDMSQRVQYMINNCPNTQLVLGGYSLGAAATDLVIAVPIAAFGFRNPLPPGAGDKVAAVVLFGNGSQWVGPIVSFNPAFANKTIELCHGEDPICNPADPDTWENNWPQHLAKAYLGAGMVNQAADFAVGKLA